MVINMQEGNDVRSGSKIQLSSEFPDPPKCYYRSYTNQNVEKGFCRKPPKIPISYKVYGNTVDDSEPLIRDLESQEIPVMYRNESEQKINMIAELQKLKRAIFYVFLDLLAVLGNEPTSPERIRLLETLRNLAVNMLHLVNSYRPHQARETIHTCLKQQMLFSQDIAKELSSLQNFCASLIKECLVNTNTSDLESIRQEVLQIEGRICKMRSDQEAEKCTLKRDGDFTADTVDIEMCEALQL